MVSEALRIVDEEGADALSMRSLAHRLNSGTATLYRHFGSRAGLVGQVVDAVYAETELDDESLQKLTWQEACRRIALTMFKVLGRHRNVAPLLVEAFPTGPHALGVRERCLAVLLGNGFSPGLAARTYAVLSRYVLGFGVQLQVADGGQPETGSAAVDVLHALDPDEFPATTQVAGQLPVPLAEEFDFGLTLLIGGLGGLVDPTPSAGAATTRGSTV
jgi:TetR/AcrR family transcriptional regulator, tetracycline repressor protein